MTSLFRQISDHVLENAEPEKSVISQNHKPPDGGKLGPFLESQAQRLRHIKVLKKPVSCSYHIAYINN